MTSRNWVVTDVVPGYGERWRKGYQLTSGNSLRIGNRLVLRPNALNVALAEITRQLYSVKSKSPGSKSNGSTGIPVLSTPGVFPGDLMASAISAWYAEAGGFVTNVGEMYATRKLTVDMMAKTVSRLYHAVKAARRLDWRGICGHLGITIRRPKGFKGKYYTPDELWLEYQYGWKPLLQSVYDLTNAKFKDPFCVVRKKRKRTVYVGPITGSTGQIQYTALAEDQFTAVVVATVTVKDLAKATGAQMGLNNPAALAWELLPFSFIVDWFAPIGPWLENLTALGGCTVSFATQSQVTHRVYRSFSSGLTDQSAKTYTMSGRPGAEGFSHKKVRTPGISVNPLPRLKNPISLGHFANAMSLLAGAFKGPGVGRRRLF